MTVPTDDRFIEPLIRFLAAHPDGVPARNAHQPAASTWGLSDDDRQQQLPSGAQPMDKNGAGWAHDRLQRAGLSGSPRRGFWQATADGLALVAGTPTPFPSELVEKLATGGVDVQLRAATSPAKLESAPATSSRLALPELPQAAESELLELLAAVTPGDFETTVRDLLHRLGDGGIDGVISLDRLGLEKLDVQAKRCQECIGRPHLQAFDGAGLAGRMIDVDVGVTARTIQVPKIDGDDFDEEGG